MKNQFVERVDGALRHTAGVLSPENDTRAPERRCAVDLFERKGQAAFNARTVLGLTDRQGRNDANRDFRGKTARRQSDRAGDACFFFNGQFNGDLDAGVDRDAGTTTR